jgi:hypothetical protein
VLGGGVWRHAGIRYDAGYRRGVDDCSAPGSQHMCEFVLHREEHTLEVHADDPVPIRLGHLRERSSGREDAGIVEGRVQATEGLDGRAYESLHVRRACYVGLDKSGLAAGVLDQADRLLSLLVDVADDDCCAVRCKEQRSRTSDTGCPAGDEYDLPRVVKHLVSHGILRSYRTRSTREKATFCRVVGAGQERGTVASQEGDKISNLAWLAETTERVQRRDGATLGLRNIPLDQPRLDESRTYGVDPNAVCRMVERGRLGQSNDPMLCGDVSGQAGNRDLPKIDAMLITEPPWPESRIARISARMQ